MAIGLTEHAPGMMGAPVASALALFASVFGVSALAQQLPDDPARKVLLEACVQCHDLSPIVTQGKDAQAWGRTVDEMIWRGAPLYTGERELVTRYLAEFFREPLANNKAVSAAAPDEKESLPPGAGREILVSACVACHDLSVILAPRKSEVEWRHTIDLMVALGSRLSGLDKEALVDYLVENRGNGE